MKTIPKNQPARLGGIMAAFMGILLLFTNASAQTGSVNFSGTWAFNESKSTQSQGGFRMAPAQMVVKHDGNSLAVESTSNGPNGEFKSTSNYTADGKECSNTFFGDNVRKSVLKWSADGKSLSFAHSMTFEMNGETRDFKTTETWSINSADNTLSVESVFTGQNGEVRRTNVYDRK